MYVQMFCSAENITWYKYSVSFRVKSRFHLWLASVNLGKEATKIGLLVKRVTA